MLSWASRPEPAQFEADPRFSRYWSARPRARRFLSTKQAARPLTDCARSARGLGPMLDRQAHPFDGAMFGYGTPIGATFRPQFILTMSI